VEKVLKSGLLITYCGLWKSKMWIKEVFHIKKFKYFQYVFEFSTYKKEQIHTFHTEKIMYNIKRKR
jgi:hypothetical protein